MESPPQGIVSRFGYPTLLTAVLIYFAQGLREFASTAKTLYFKTKFGFDPAELTLVGSLTVLAWYLKPIYGLFSDCYPLFGYRRRSYLFFSGVLGIISYLFIFFAETSTMAVTCLILGEFSQAICDVICDGFLVERSKLDPINGANDLQKLSWSSMFFASMFGMLSGGLAANYVNPTYLITALAFCPLLVMSTSFFIPDEKVNEIVGIGQAGRRVWESLKLLGRSLIAKDNLRVVIFTFCWCASAVGFGAIYLYFLLDVLAIQPFTLSVISFGGYLGGFIGTVLSGSGCWKLKLVQRFFIGRVLLALITVLDIVVFTGYYEMLGMSVYPFLYGPSSIGGAVEMFFTRMPLMVIFAKITPKSIEATFFAGMAGLSNFSMNFSDVIAGGIMYATGINDSYNENIWVLTVVSIGIGAVSLVFLIILPESVEGPGNCETVVGSLEIEMPLLK